MRRLRRGDYRWSLLTRHTLLFDVIAALPLAILAGVMNYLFCGFVARKALHMPDTLLSLLLACNMLGLLLAAPVVSFFNHKNTTSVISTLVVIAAAMMTAIGLVVHTGDGSSFVAALAQIAAAAGFASMKKTLTPATPLTTYDRGEPPNS